MAEPDLEAAAQFAELKIAEEHSPAEVPDHVLMILWTQDILEGWTVYFKTNIQDYKRYLVTYNSETEEASVTVIFDPPPVRG